jgi:hypothetical protein
MVTPTVDTDVTEQVLANTDPAAGSASVTVTRVPGATSVKAKSFAGGELVATRRVDIG